MYKINDLMTFSIFFFFPSFSSHLISMEDANKRSFFFFFCRHQIVYMHIRQKKKNPQNFS